MRTAHGWLISVIVLPQRLACARGADVRRRSQNRHIFRWNLVRLRTDSSPRRFDTRACFEEHLRPGRKSKVAAALFVTKSGFV